MTDRLTTMVFIVALAVVFAWAYRPDQSRYDRLHPSQARQPAVSQ